MAAAKAVAAAIAAASETEAIVVHAETAHLRENVESVSLREVVAAAAAAKVECVATTTGTARSSERITACSSGRSIASSSFQAVVVVDLSLVGIGQNVKGFRNLLKLFRVSRGLVWMVFKCHLSVCLFDFRFVCRGRHPQQVVKFCLSNHCECGNNLW